jgi:hypothetical protein
VPRSTLRALVPRALPPAPPRAGHTLPHPSRRTVGARPAGRTAGHGENVPPWRRVLALPPADPAWAPCPTRLSTSSGSVPHRSTSSTEPAHSVREGRRTRRAATRRPGRRTSRTRVTVDTVPGSQDTSCRLCTLSGFPVDELRRAAHGCAQGPDDGARPRGDGSPQSCGCTGTQSPCVQVPVDNHLSPQLSTRPGGMSTARRRPSPDQQHCVPNSLCTGHSVLCTDPATAGVSHKLVHLPVDNCGRRGTSCGQRRAGRWTAICGQLVVNSACDLPTGPYPLRPHAESASDLQGNPFSTLCTAPMTTTNDL